MNLIDRWVRKLYRKDVTDQKLVSTIDDRADAKCALQSSKDALNTAVEAGADVTAVAQDLRAQRELNHFGELLAASMRRA